LLDAGVALDFCLVGGMRVLGYDDGGSVGEVGRVQKRDGLRFGDGGDIVGEGVFGGELEVDGLLLDGFGGGLEKRLL
jgi:hypothetical protein